MTESQKLINICHIQKSCTYSTITFSSGLQWLWIGYNQSSIKQRQTALLVSFFVFTYFHLTLLKKPTVIKQTSGYRFPKR